MDGSVEGVCPGCRVTVHTAKDGLDPCNGDANKPTFRYGTNARNGGTHRSDDRQWAGPRKARPGGRQASGPFAGTGASAVVADHPGADIHGAARSFRQASDRLGDAPAVVALGQVDAQLLELAVQVGALQSGALGHAGHAAMLAVQMVLEVGALEGLAGFA